MNKRKPMKCSYRTFQINHNNEVWCITQDIRRKRNFRTGEHYMGRLTEKQIQAFTKQMGISLIIRLKQWKSVLHPAWLNLKAI